MFVLLGLHHQLPQLVVGAAGFLPGRLGAGRRPPLGLGRPLGLGDPPGGELAELLGSSLRGGAPLGLGGGLEPLGLLGSRPLGLGRSLGGLLEGLDLGRGELGLLDGQLGLLGGEVALVGLLLVSSRLERNWSSLLRLEPLLLLGSRPELLLGNLLELLLLRNLLELLLGSRPGGQATLQLLELLGRELLRLAGLL